MSKINDTFFNAKRPWSVVKDELLAYYLVPYFQKLLHTRCPITYVDCFAGAGKFEDNSDGSPVIALKIIKKCLSQTTVKNPLIKPYFIEANHYDLLKKNLSSYSNINIIGGKFEEHIGEILIDNIGQNIFLYIDPYGVKKLDFNLLASLNSGDFNTVEVLLNLNSVGFLRAACAALNIKCMNTADLQSFEEYDDSLPKSSTSLTEMLNKVAGGEYWKKIIEDYHNEVFDFYGAEEKFVAEYCKKLREHYRYVLNMPIRMKLDQSPKYRMIHVTNHLDGIILMADNMLKREKNMREIQHGRQLTLFEDDPLVDLEKILSKYLSQFREFEHLNKILADFFCEYGVADVKPVLKKFEKQGQILVERNPSAAEKGSQTKFWEEKGRRQTVK